MRTSRSRILLAAVLLIGATDLRAQTSEAELRRLEAEYAELSVEGERPRDARRDARESGDSLDDLESEYANLEIDAATSAEATSAEAASPGIPASTDADEVNWLTEFFADPTFDGRLRLEYRAVYEGRLHDFDGYDVAFPQGFGPDDAGYARELTRRHRDVQDHDLDQYLSIDWERVLESDSSLWQQVDIESSLRHYLDLDGSSNGEASLGTFDRFAGGDAVQLLTASARIDSFERHLSVRVGRQQRREAEWIHFDGVTATFRGVEVLGRPLELTAFGGARARIYRRTSSEHEGLFGGSLTYAPTSSLELRLSDVHYLDNTLLASARQSFADLGLLELSYRQIDDDPESIRLSFDLDWAEADVDVWAFYIGKLGRDARDFDFDYTRSRRRDPAGTKYLRLGDLAPYDEISLELRKGIFEHHGVFVGGTAHRVRERDLRDERNTDWEEIWAGVDTLHTPWEGLTGRATARYLHTDHRRQLLRLDPAVVIGNNAPDFQPEDIIGDGEPSFLGLEMLLEQSIGRASVGAIAILRSYAYESNYARLENLDATSLTGYLRYPVSRRLEFYVGYSYDTDFQTLYPDLEVLHTLRVVLSLRL